MIGVVDVGLLPPKKKWVWFVAILKQEKQKDPHLQHLAAAVFCCFLGGRGLYRKDRAVG